jgi:hypothetical protein
LLTSDIEGGRHTLRSEASPPSDLRRFNSEFTTGQDGQECASRQVDGDKIFFSHFIRSPVRRLQAKSWAEIKISGDKLVDHKYGSKNKDKEFKDKYKVAGRAKVRLLTTEGAFDFPIDLDIEVDEFPF